MDTVIQAIGWTGTLLILIAYFLVSMKKLEATSPKYQVLNLVGALCLGLNVFYMKAWSAFALEVVWGLIALAALVKRR